MLFSKSGFSDDLVQYALIGGDVMLVDYIPAMNPELSERQLQYKNVLSLLSQQKITKLLQVGEYKIRKYLAFQSFQPIAAVKQYRYKPGILTGQNI